MQKLGGSEQAWQLSWPLVPSPRRTLTLLYKWEIEVQRKKKTGLPRPPPSWQQSVSTSLQPLGFFRPTWLRKASAAGALNLASSSSLGNFSRTRQIGARSGLSVPRARTPFLPRFPGGLVPSFAPCRCPRGAPRAAPKVPRRPGLQPGHPDQDCAREAAGTRGPATRSPNWGTGPPEGHPRRWLFIEGIALKSLLGAGDS